MIKWIIASVVAVLALSAGVAYAATQLASDTVTQVCVNNVNGAMRAASVCRDAEHAATIGGGGEVQVTQNGTFTEGPGGTVEKTLPLSGITVTGECEHSSGGGYEFLVGKLKLQAAFGMKLDAFGSGSMLQDVIQGDSLLVYPLGAVGSAPNAPEHAAGVQTIIATSNGVTATVIAGGTADWSDQACTVLWQAVEAPD